MRFNYRQEPGFEFVSTVVLKRNLDVAQGVDHTACDVLIFRPFWTVICGLEHTMLFAFQKCIFDPS